MREKIFNILKFFISGALLYLLLSRANLQLMYRTLIKLNIPVYILATFLFFLAVLFSSLRWQIVLGKKDIHIPLFTLLKFYIISLFVGIFLPSGGLDVVRALYASRYGSKSETLGATFIDRLSGFYGVLLYIIIGFIALPNELTRYRQIVAAGLITLLLLNVILFLKPVNDFLNKNLPDSRIFGFVKRFINSIYFYRKVLPIFLTILPLSLLIQALYALSVITISFSLNAPLPFIRGLFYVPLINFLAMIPVTISGFGIREGGFAYFFGNFVGKENAILISFLYYFASILVSLPGALFFVLDKPVKDVE